MDLSEVDKLSTVEMRATLYRLAQSESAATRQAIADVLSLTRPATGLETSGYVPSWIRDDGEPAEDRDETGRIERAEGAS